MGTGFKITGCHTILQSYNNLVFRFVALHSFGFSIALGRSYPAFLNTLHAVTNSCTNRAFGGFPSRSILHRVQAA